MELKLFDTSAGGFSTKAITVKDVVFTKVFNEALIHQVVRAYAAGARTGSKAQKSRSEVSGGGIKPWRQKGTGRARAGTIRSPLWRGGGVTFAAKPRDFSQKVNKKMYRSAICSILSELVRQERLLVVDNFSTTGKTRDLAKKFKDLKIDEVLIVTDSMEPGLFLAARNLPRVDVIGADSINPRDLISFEKILMTVSALRRIEERLV